MILPSFHIDKTYNKLYNDYQEGLESSIDMAKKLRQVCDDYLINCKKIAQETIHAIDTAL